MNQSNLVNNNVSALNGESSGMTTSNLVTSILTRQVPYNSYSLNFDDGSSNYIDLGTALNSMLELDDSFSVSAWVKFGANNTQRTIISNFTTAIKGFQFRVLDNECIRFIIAEAGSKYKFVDSTSLAIDTWHHAVFTYDGSNTIGGLNLYINGSLDNNTTGSSGTVTTITSTDSLKIGAYTSSDYFEGNINNVSLFNVVLTPTEIMKLYNSGVPGDLSSFNPSPTAWWSLGSDSYFNGNDWICPDLVGSNNGTSSGMDANALIGDAPNSTANGTSTNISIDANLIGSAPNSSNNSFSVNMDYTDRVEDVAPTP